jgi:competence protein ComEC
MRARGAKVLGPRDVCGAHALGGAEVDVLAPCPSFSSDEGANDNSFVLRIRHGPRSVLFVGDAERGEEAKLVATRADDLRADVLKVGHHGSRTSSTEGLLERVSPRVAVVSCGVRNRFGHPHASTIARLARFVAEVHRTDREGAVTAWTDGREWHVRTAAAP